MDALRSISLFLFALVAASMIVSARGSLSCTPGFDITVAIYSDKNVSGAQQADPQLFNSTVAQYVSTEELLTNGERWFNYTYGVDLSGVASNPSGFPWKSIPGVVDVFLLMSNYDNLYEQYIGMIRGVPLSAAWVSDRAIECVSEREFFMIFSLYPIQYNGTYGAMYPGPNTFQEASVYYGIYVWDITAHVGSTTFNITKVFWACPTYPQLAKRDPYDIDRFHSPLYIDDDESEHSFGIGDSVVRTHISPAFVLDPQLPQRYRQRKNIVFPAQYPTNGITDKTCIPH